MNDITDFLAEWWLLLIILGLAFFGAAVLAGEFPAAFRDWLRGNPPKPRPFRVLIEDPDGWPIRSFSLPAEGIGRVMKEAEREKPT